MNPPRYELTDAAPLGLYFADPAALARWRVEGEHRLRDVGGVLRDVLDRLLPPYTGPLPAGTAMPRRGMIAPGSYGPWFVALDGEPYLRARIAAKCNGAPNYAFADDACAAILAEYLQDPIGILGPYPDGWTP